MPNRRETIHDFYRTGGAGSVLQKSAASAIPIPFRGNQLAHTIVTRTDLNGYSAWARDKTAAQRAIQLDVFFSTVVPLIDAAGGVYFRDEGDCIVALFSDYFMRGATRDGAERYCMTASTLVYGPGRLTAKTCVACGPVVYFQKAHEVPIGDWSAEGEPMVRAARLEQAVASKSQVAYYADEYDGHFANTNLGAAVGPTPRWDVIREGLQVPGIGAAGGWVDVVRLERTR